MPRILFTVTNDLTYDQRMQRICASLAGAGYVVELIGRELPHSVPLEAQPYAQRRLRCWFHKGFLFYAEYNLRLWLYLLCAPCDAVCSIDLDTLPAGCAATLLRRKKRVFDAHEYFTEVPEVVGRRGVRFFWEMVARICLPFYRHAYTVGPALAQIFEKKYDLRFDVVRNVAASQSKTPPPPSQRDSKVLLYQGALNEGRGIEHLLQAMRHLESCELWLAGEGDRSGPLRKMAADLGVQERVRFLGHVRPADLKTRTAQAWLGLNVLENKGLSYYYSLANKFFDYVQAGVPVLTMNFPEYRALNAQHEVALLLDDLTPEAIVHAVQDLQKNPDVYQRLQQATQAARREWNWEKEADVLLQVWARVVA